MPRKKLVRRFDPFGGVSQPMVEAEAKYLAREIDNTSVLSRKDVAKERSEHHRLCRESWEHLQLILAGIGDRERAVIQSLLFRDFYHILALYIFQLQRSKSELSASSPLPASNATPAEFTEWLFDLPSSK